MVPTVNAHAHLRGDLQTKGGENHGRLCLANHSLRSQPDVRRHRHPNPLHGRENDLEAHRGSVMPRKKRYDSGNMRENKSSLRE